ncbi:uncharacterized protein HD556DRAFT_1451684 [Suillus plorans]|uniref:Uncharacterized protein n=1 Tax=Suillus plorans TaxID=116603 RepID=A0A9P7A9D6_9AGAM|nr:uncharacterized protein HD556DRAFT_1451684 [Suillus plorans]KAG1784528.1 hypothetical protein HD556DRAFT_1451684 [Suillus plorans]
MPSRRIHFTPPVNETWPDPVATTGESHSLQMQEAHQEWWGNFVPIADWVPPKMNKSKFDGMKIQKYHISPEIDEPGDPECPYDRAFAGANDTVGELTAMFQNEWVSNRRAATPANADVNMDVSYDLRWDTAPEAGIDSGETTGQSVGVDPEASYDLGWDSAPDAGDLHPGETPRESVEVDLEATYDLGWDGAPALPSDLPSETTEPSNSIDIDDEYDLGWDGAPALHSDSPPEIMEPLIDSIDIDNEYDLGWGDAVDDGHQSCNPIDIDEAYDLGWNNSASMEQAKEQQVEYCLSPLTSGSDLRAGDEDANASVASITSVSRPEPSNSTPDAILHAEAAMMQAIRRLNALGHTDDDQQMHVIMQTAIQGLAPSHGPSRVRRANSRLFGAYSEARNWVTELGEDILSITRLIHMYNAIMDPLDVLVKDLKRVDREQ